MLGTLLVGFKGNPISFCAPIFSYGEGQGGRAYEDLFTQIFLPKLPVFAYVWEHDEENLLLWEDLTQIEPEQTVEETKEEERDDTEELALQEALERENQQAQSEMEGGNEGIIMTETFSEVFLPHEKQISYEMSEYQEFSTLFETFYAMDSRTMVGREQLNLDSLLSPDMTIDKEAEGPQILIYHTHSQEGFADSVPGDASTTVVGAGEKLTKILTEEYGYKVLHHTGEYDVTDRDSAYSRALPGLKQILEENPSIQLVIDLHRDGVRADRRLVVDLDGRPTAQFMFFDGLSRTKNTGDIDYLKNPYQAENLALSFQLQLASNEYYPGLARKIYLHGYRYNMHLRRSMLIELGAQTNTVEEAMNAVDPLAHVINLVLSGEADTRR